MKRFFIAISISSIFISIPTLAAPVSVSFHNLGAVPMTVSKLSTCAALYPELTSVAPKSTSSVSTADCGTSITAVHVGYSMGLKNCTFHISVTYKNPPMFLKSGGWIPNYSVEQSGGARCKIESQAFSGIESGAFKAVFSMK
ncbi:hypothetical protein [Zymomonas mobilis]|uniref:hypothetical protein n=1 Tax=Zymomonas mobilis TaxID=542 RepID=UPI0011A7DAC9|nr:hypothetical protein [Zymomonas mobilis]